MSQSSRHWIYVLLFLLFSGFLSFVGWDTKFGSALTRILLALMLPYVLFKHANYPNTPIMRLAFCLMCVPFLSIFSCYIAHGQSMLDTFIVTFHMCGYLLLPMMYILRVEEKWLLRFCFLIGLFWAFVPLIQQFTWPNYWFATGGENEETGEPQMRNGIIRYGTFGLTQGLLMLFYALQAYLNTNKRKWLVWMLVGLLGVYMTCTRQVMAASVGCILVGLFLSGKLRLAPLLGLLLVGVVIYLNADALFGEYAEMTERDTTNEDYIRLYSYRYYGWEMNDGNPLTILLGNGMHRLEHSKYGDMMDKVRMALGMYASDVGLVGMYAIYGIFFVLAILSFYWYIFRNRHYLPLYLQLFVLYMFVTNVMLWHFAGNGLLSTCIVFYLIENSLRKNRAAELSADDAE